MKTRVRIVHLNGVMPKDWEDAINDAMRNLNEEGWRVTKTRYITTPQGGLVAAIIEYSDIE